MIQLKHLLREVLTDEQNRGLKAIYIFIRDILWDFRSKALAAGITQNDLVDYNSLAPKVNPFWSQYVPPKGTRKNAWAVDVVWPKEYLKIFPDLDPEFRIKIKPLGDTIGLGKGLIGQKVGSLTVSMKSLLDDPDTIKSQLQHEVQHIVTYGADVEEEGDESKQFMNWFEYFRNDGEMNAYAKQFAYLYYKKFPNDKELDGKKFRETIIPKLTGGPKSALNFYLSCGEKTEAVKAKWKLDDKTTEEIVKMYKTLVQLLAEHFRDFLKK